MWLWPSAVVYAGPALDLVPHRLPVPCLVVGVDGGLTFTVGGAAHEARSACVPPRTAHHLDAGADAWIVSGYVDPGVRRPGGFGRWASGLGFDHDREPDLLVPPADPATAMAWLDVAAPVRDPGGVDARIARLVSVRRDDPAGTLSAGELADHVGLSESRLLHLFRAETGTSLRAYRLWARLLHASRAVARGSDLTAAAADAGFASPSHLADRFKATFGLSATSLLGTGATLHVAE